MPEEPDYEGMSEKDAEKAKKKYERELAKAQREAKKAADKAAKEEAKRKKDEERAAKAGAKGGGRAKPAANGGKSKEEEEAAAAQAKVKAEKAAANNKRLAELNDDDPVFINPPVRAASNSTKKVTVRVRLIQDPATPAEGTPTPKEPIEAALQLEGFAAGQKFGEFQIAAGGGVTLISRARRMNDGAARLQAVQRGRKGRTFAAETKTRRAEEAAAAAEAARIAAEKEAARLAWEAFVAEMSTSQAHEIGYLPVIRTMHD